MKRQVMNIVHGSYFVNVNKFKIGTGKERVHKIIGNYKGKNRLYHLFHYHRA